MANGAFDGYQYGGRVEGGWRFGFDKNVLTPFAGLTVQALTQSAYTETSRNAATGAPGVLGLTVQGQTSTSIRSTLGAQFETAITATDDAILRPRLRLGYRRTNSTSTAPPRRPWARCCPTRRSRSRGRSLRPTRWS